MNFHFCLIYSGVCYDMIPVGWVSLFSHLSQIGLLSSRLLKIGPMVGSPEVTMLQCFCKSCLNKESGRRWTGVGWEDDPKSATWFSQWTEGFQVGHQTHPAAGWALSNGKHRIRLFKVQSLLKTAENCTEPHLWQEGDKNKREICSMSFQVPFGVYFGPHGAVPVPSRGLSGRSSECHLVRCVYLICNGLRSATFVSELVRFGNVCLKLMSWASLI